MESQLPILQKLNSQKNFSELLNEHHIQGVICHFFSHANQSPELNTQYKKQWIHNSILLEEIESLGQTAKHNSTSATLLKGAHLLQDIYTDHGSRFLSDVDLLIKSGDLKSWEKILTDCGFTQRNSEKFYGNVFKQDWFKFVGEVEINIELHTRLFFHQKKESWNTVSANEPYTKLALEDLLVHLCGHLAFQHTFLKLYWPFDIYFLVKKYKSQIDWEKLLISSEEHKLFRSVQMCLWVLKKYFNLEFDEKAEKLFKLNTKYWWQSILTLDFLINPMANKTKYYLMKHATKDRLSTALYYDLTWFFHTKVQRH